VLLAQVNVIVVVFGVVFVVVWLLSMVYIVSMHDKLTILFINTEFVCST